MCNVGVPVLVGGSEGPVSKGLIMFDSMSVDPYETNVESCVGNDNDDRRRARRTVYGFSLSGFTVSSISVEVGIFVKSVTSLWCGLSG